MTTIRPRTHWSTTGALHHGDVDGCKACKACAAGDQAVEFVEQNLDVTLTEWQELALRGRFHLVEANLTPASPLLWDGDQA